MVLTKRYRSWSRGEHRREWSVLQHVHRYAPDLVAGPLTADLDADPPIVTMTVVPGQPLHGVPTATQLDALAAAIGELWRGAHDGAPAGGPRAGGPDFPR